MSLATLRKNSGNLDRLTKELEKINQPKTDYKQKDERVWRCEQDKAGNGYAVIRFLPGPAVDGDDSLPWVRYFDHGFQGPTGKWYIENSLTTLGKDVKDPVSEFNSQLWAQSTDDNSWQRKQVRAQKRRLHYVSNILVIEDPKNPQNNGKVFLFKYGKKIFDKITQAMNPEFQDEKPMNPFDFWTGADFKLKIRKVEGYTNYDKSEFNAPSALYGGDETKLGTLHQSEFSLLEFVAPDKFKSYEKLKEQLQKVLGIDVTSGVTQVHSNQEQTIHPAATPKVAATPAVKQATVMPVVEDDDDDDLAKFSKLIDDED